MSFISFTTFVTAINMAQVLKRDVICEVYLFKVILDIYAKK